MAVPRNEIVLALVAAASAGVWESASESGDANARDGALKKRRKD